MATERDTETLRYIRAVFRGGIAAELTDSQLLDRFASRAGDSAELGFALLVERHGPMVLRTCRTILRDDHDAHDAFQAVFLILVRRAGSFRIGGSLGPWLHGVALRVATSARDSSNRRKALEQRALAMANRPLLRAERPADDIGPAIHEEVGKLPDAYRKAVVLCDLEGLSHDEAARRLGWPVGTVKSRQARGRNRLRARLIRRGLTPATIGAAALLAAETASAALPIRLVDSTVRVASLVASNQAAPGLISAATLALTQGALRAMLFNRIKIAASALVLAGSLTGATAWSIQAVEDVKPSAKQATPKAEQPRTPRNSPRDAESPAEKRIEMPGNAVAVLGDRRGHHAGAVYGLALSPDGKILATCSDDDMKIRLWDPKTFEPIGALAGHRAFVNCIAISPDGRRLASGSSYGDFLIWDLTVTPPNGPTRLIPPYHLIHATAFSADSTILAISGAGAGSGDGKGAGLFDISGQQPVPLGPLPGLDQEVRSLTFSPVGRTLALAGLEDGSVRLWDVSQKPPRQICRLDQPVVGLADDREKLRGAISVAFAPDGKTLAVLRKDDGVQLWDLSTEPPADRGVLDTYRNDAVHHFNVSSRFWAHATVAFAPNGKTIAAAQRSGSIRLWNIAGVTPLYRSISANHSEGVGPLAFARDGKTLISGGGDQLIRSWDIEAEKPREILPPQGPTGGLKVVAFSPDGRTLAAGGDDPSIRLWDVHDLREPTRIAAPRATIPAGAVKALAFSPDGKTLAADGDLFWDVSKEKPSRIGPIRADALSAIGVSRAESFDGAWSLAFSPDGKTMVTGNAGGRVQLWGLTGPIEIAKDVEEPPAMPSDGKPRRIHIGPPAVVAFSPDGNRLAFSGPKDSVRIWDLTGKEPSEQARLEGTGWRISSLAFSPDAKILAAGTNGGTRLWDLSGKAPRPMHPAPKASDLTRSCLGFSLAFTPDGKTLVAADQVSPGDPAPSRPAVCVYDVTSGKRVHEWDLSAPCWSIALAPDGRHVAAAQRDGLVVILRMPPDGR